MRLNDKVALVTGAAQGIGRAIAERFAEEGAYVYVGDIKQPDEPFESERITFVPLDVANQADWDRVLREVLQRHGQIDVLVNNAGIIVYESLADIAPDAWQRALAINQTGTLYGMQAVLPAMRQRQRGSIINLSSIWGKVAVSGAVAYHATKGAVLMMTKNAAITYAREGVRVNSLHPGIIATPLIKGQPADLNDGVVAATPMGRMGEPREIANGALFLASDEASFMTGAELVIDGGYTGQ